MTKHTRGPLKLEGRTLRDRRGLAVAHITISVSYPGGSILDDEAAENARRLVALWNAADRLKLTTNGIECGALDAAWGTALDQVDTNLRAEQQA